MYETHMRYGLVVEDLEFEQFGPVPVLLGYDHTGSSLQETDTPAIEL